MTRNGEPNRSHPVPGGASPGSRVRANWKIVIGLAHGWRVKKIAAFA